MKTKERIIAQAIATYNAEGVSNVTSRDLAKLLGISHGNLEYHFPNKEALLMAIYEQMRTEISKAYEVKAGVEEPFGAFHDLLQRLEIFQDKYRFFNLDFLEIARKYKQVGALLHQTLILRKKQLSFLFEQFQQRGYIQEGVGEEQYQHLLHSVMILITFWKKQEEVLPFPREEEIGMVQAIWNLLLPNLTEKGRNLYHTLNSQKHV